MENKKILLTAPLNINLYEELERKIYYISDKIKHYEILTDNEQITGIGIFCEDEADINEMEQKVNHFIDDDIRPRRVIKSNRIWTSHFISDFNLSDFDELIHKGLVIEMGEGQMAFSEDLLRLMDFFDKQIMDIVRQEFGAIEYRYPTLISTSTIRKCGYFNTFPHFLMMVTRLHNDYENYKKFRNSLSCCCENELKNTLLQYCKNTDYCLPPTMCYYTYQQYKDKFVDDYGCTITSKGKSFRYESLYHKSMERLWDFTIREIVFMGKYDYVLSCRKKMMDRTFELMNNIGLMSCCETASDPFFLDENANQRVLFQKSLQSKYELRGHISKEKTIAIASFNYHETFFSKNFNIRFNDDTYIQTGCVGFGLERLVYTFLCQYGCDKEGWPRAVRDHLKTEG